METVHVTQTSHTPLESKLTTASNGVQLESWMPPQAGITPVVRIGKKWISLLWIVPITVVFLILLVAVAQQLRTMPAVQAFIAQYPGYTSSRTVTSGFPLWLRLQHIFNFFFMLFMIRAGLQILADHPRLYLNRDCTPGTDWFKFQHDVPLDRVWTAKDDSVELPGWLGIPGVRHTVGLARWWHFSFDLLWVLNGLIFYVLLFATDQWQRLVPTSWTVFPNALSTALQYASLQFPVEHAWTNYNGLQQLAYFVTVFMAAPLAFVTGVMQGPAFSNRLGWIAKVINRQAARTIHFLVLSWFLLFIFIHVTLVFITGMRQNLNYMFAGVNNSSWAGFFIFLPIMALFIILWMVATPFTLKHSRWVQKAGDTLVGGVKTLAELWSPTTQYKESDISPYFWVNGTFPASDEYDRLEKNHFADYQLQVYGLVEKPQAFSYTDLKAMPKQEQITQHFCIQGWSGVAKWGGIPVRHILDLVGVKPEARYVVFYSFADGADGGIYYDVHTLRNMRHKLSILAYEMNGEPLNYLHGAPLRLRCENQLGFKMVKWIQAIELVDDFSHLGSGQGGYNEDHEYYGNRMPI